MLLLHLSEITAFIAGSGKYELPVSDNQIIDTEPIYWYRQTFLLQTCTLSFITYQKLIRNNKVQSYVFSWDVCTDIRRMPLCLAECVSL